MRRPRTGERRKEQRAWCTRPAEIAAGPIDQPKALAVRARPGSIWDFPETVSLTVELIRCSGPPCALRPVVIVEEI